LFKDYKGQSEEAKQKRKVGEELGCADAPNALSMNPLLNWNSLKKGLCGSE
jgi:hypothetical protein